MTTVSRLINTDRLKNEIAEALPISRVAVELCDVELAESGHLAAAVLAHMIVGAEYLESRRESVGAQPGIQVPFSDFATMLVPTTVRMVNHKHSSVGFAADGASVAVGGEDGVQQLSVDAFVLGRALGGVVASPLGGGCLCRAGLALAAIGTPKLAASGYLTEPGFDAGVLGFTGVGQ